METHVKTNAPGKGLFSKTLITWTSFIISPLVGFIFLAANERELGEPQKAKNFLIAGWLLFIATIALALFIDNWHGSFALGIIPVLAFRSYQRERYDTYFEQEGIKRKLWPTSAVIVTVFLAIAGIFTIINLVDSFNKDPIEKAGDLYDEGKISEATALIDQQIKDTPDDPDAYIYKSVDLANEGKISEAVQITATAIEKEKTTPMSYYPKGYSYYLSASYKNMDPLKPYPNNEILSDLAQSKKEGFYEIANDEARQDMLEIEVISKTTNDDITIAKEGCSIFETNRESFTPAFKSFIGKVCATRAKDFK